MCVSSKPTKSTKHAPTKETKVSAARWDKPKGPTFVYQTRSYIPRKQAVVDEWKAKRAFMKSKQYAGRRMFTGYRGLPPRWSIKFHCPCGGFHVTDSWSKYEVDDFYFCPDTIHFFPNEDIYKENHRVNKIMATKWAEKEAKRKAAYKA
mmetsp:Transcript_2317/g.5216  ORF Transcript_2317/g.5216 Transcript_2317/m.5216 type:complete len:149 (+) Transcript_2317:313-759(+)